MDEEIEMAWAALPVPRREAADFLALFSRFEYALKRAGFLKERPWAEPDWEEFAGCLGFECAESGTDLDEIRRGARYLIAAPPKRQVQRDRRLGWAPIVSPPAVPDIGWMLLATRTIRNNLFHGGKYPDEPPQDPERDSRLVQSAKFVLIGCLRLQTQSARDVRAHYYTA